jgi:hypothetical protein
VRNGQVDTALLERIVLPEPSAPDDGVFAAAAAAFSSKGGRAEPGRGWSPPALAGADSFMDPFSAGSFRILR